ncbi:hypothetical protein JTE90_003033 [Oedothorax gibbosus]|uniref:Uncharacterized protein n=1 Tax=Oedothorax gibbosus TaxID=931172 RepID=A0AAV6VDU4_9ARAC|nr:hypothetical protein JTE90_003033 [Oedothorax gibbosus]
MERLERKQMEIQDGPEQVAHQSVSPVNRDTQKQQQRHALPIVSNRMAAGLKEEKIFYAFRDNGWRRATFTISFARSEDNNCFWICVFST